MRSKDQILLESIYSSMSIHGWMDPSGKMIPNEGHQRHLDTAIEILKKIYHLTNKQIFIEITPENIFEYLFVKQWLRITFSGPIIYCHNTIRPPTQKQLNELKNLCLEFNKTQIIWDNEAEDKVIWTKGDLMEMYYDTRKPVEGYVDADELIGQRLWVHTNRTHRNQGYNGMVGIYGVNSKGHRTGSPLNYTNEIRLKGPIVFEASEVSAETIVKSKKRTLVAGTSGIVEKTEGDTNGMEEVNFQPEVKWFYRVSDPEKTKITTADEIYFSADESGKYTMLAKNPR